MRYKYQARDKEIALRYASSNLGVGVDELNVVKVKKNFDSPRTVTVMIKLNSKIESMMIDFIEHLLGYMDVDFDADFVTKREDNRIWLTIDSEIPALLIGNRGKNPRRPATADKHVCQTDNRQGDERGVGCA